jgi:hypothetical protein
MSKPGKQIWLFAILFLALLVGCSSSEQSDSFSDAPATLSSEDLELLAEEDSDNENTAESIRLEDECLIGVWAADHESLSKYLSDSMNISDEVTFNITEVSGDLILSFDGNEMGFQTQSEPLNVTVQIVVDDFVLGTSTVAIQAFGQAEYYIYPLDMDPELLSDILVSRSPDYEVTGDGGFSLGMNEAMSGSASVLLTPGSFAVTAVNGDPVYDYIYNDPSNDGMNVGYANYVCDETELHLLSFSAESYSPTIFIRR